MENEIIKRFYEKFCEPIAEDTMWHFDKAGMDEITQFILSEYQKMVSEIIKLSDDIESRHSHTEYNEWRAFKQFRNTLREKYLNKNIRKIS